MVGREIKRAVICAVGSGGDVFPFVDVGAALRRRGVEPVVIGPERYRAYAAGAGMGFESVGADDVFERIFNGTEVWHPTKGLRASWTYYAAAMRSGLPVIRRFGSPSDTVLVGSSFALATRLAQEADGFRNLTVHLSPSVIWSAACPARWAKASIPHAWPHWLRQAAMSVAERAMVDPVLKRLVNPVRKDLGMAPVQRLFSRYVHAGRVAYAFPAWFAPPASDWPAQGAFAGFIRPNGKGTGLPEEVAAFLAEGDKVVVITAGTAVATRPGWIEATCRAALDLGRRAIVVGHAQVGFRHEHVLHTGHVPFCELFRNAAAVVHHGGIGTLAQAMRSGVPQLIFPTAHDQPDNAERASELGVSVSLPTSASSAEVRAALNRCLHDRMLADAVIGAREKLRMDGDGADRIAELALS